MSDSVTDVPARLRPRTATIIYNPLAGPSELMQTLHEAAGIWRARGWRVNEQSTQYAGHARQLARAAARQGEHLVFAAGGDGTLGEVADGLVDSETILAPLPAGTGNSLAKELHMPRPSLLNPNHLLEAAASLAAGVVHRIDVGLCDQGHHWLLWASVGVDSYLVDNMEPRSKLVKRLGPFGYVGQALLAAPGYTQTRIRVTVDDRTIEDDFLMATICNCRRYAGGELLLNPGGKLDDGQFEVWLFRGQGLTTMLSMVMQIRTGQHLLNPAIQMLTGKQVRVETEQVLAFHTDGDPAGKSPFQCQIKPAALRLLVPDTAPLGLFQHAGEPLI
ncbi:MAG: diacylglycerol kinase family lipid kinase [Anaerolineales bacterium]|nr:diacylglycerol kinase family lipid kinase [Anaerolineales bacterium]MCB8951704.1 diacylglycerol kinase family lipid kinase [Ardenticatenales bacterium]